MRRKCEGISGEGRPVELDMISDSKNHPSSSKNNEGGGSRSVDIECEMLTNDMNEYLTDVPLH